MVKVFRLGTLAVLTFALAVPARAGVERWTPYGPPEGFLVTLAIDGGRLLAATEESGVVASTDGGLTWFQSGAGLGNERIEALAVDPDDQEIYAAGQRRFFRSTDHGATWTALGALPAQSQPVNDVLALAPGEPDVFFLAIGNILYRSADDGQTWTQVLLNGTSFGSILVDPNDPHSVFAGTVEPGTLLHSGDGGTTWAQVTNVQAFPDLPPSTPPFSFGVSEITAAETSPTTFFAVSGRRLYRSKDAGAQWEEIRVPGPTPDFVVLNESVVATPGREPRIYVLQQIVESFSLKKLFVSDDLGETWDLVTEQARGTSLRIDPETGDLASFDIGGVGIAGDAGAAWRFSPLGNQSCNLFTFPRPTAKVRFGPGGRTYVVVGGRLWQSRNGGQSWSVLGRDLIDQCIAVRDVAVDPRPGVLWTATFNSVYRSQNGGASWTRSLGPVSTGEGLPFQGVTQLDSRTLLFSGYGIWRSGDRGATWKQTLAGSVLHDEFDEPEFTRAVYRVRVDPGNPQIVYAGAVERGERHPPRTLPYIYQSLDGGRTWKRIVEGGDVLAIDPTQPKTLYVAEDRGGLLRSRDRGRSFKKVGELDLGPGGAYIPNGSDLQVDPRDPRVLYAAGGDGIENLGVWRSVDRGVTWEPLQAGLGSLPAFEIFPDPRLPGRFFVASEGLFAGRFAVRGN